MDFDRSFADRYREVAIKTANPLQLVVIMYDAAVQALQEAVEHLKSKDIAARSRSLNKTVAILTELQASLDLEVGGDIGVSLDRLYTYMKQRIFRANVDQTAEPLVEVAALLANLRSAWCEVARQSGGNVPTSVVPQTPSREVVAKVASPAGSPNSLNISG